MKDLMFKGYVETKNKQCLEKFKGRTNFKNYQQVCKLREYAGILADDVILIDVDDFEQSEILMDIVEENQLNCRVYQTTRGRHFLFKNVDEDGELIVEKCSGKPPLAIGIKADVKVGKNNSYEILKFNGEERFIEWDIEPGLDYEPVPKYLTPINYGMDFLEMKAGDGRNQALFNYILTLQTSGFSVEQCRTTIRIINKFVLPDPLPEDELEVVLREDAFKKPIFFQKGKFVFNKFAQYIISASHVVRINGQLHIYSNGIYINGYREIEATMIKHIPSLRKTQRMEVINYMELIAPRIRQADANYIAFKNGIYDIVQDKLVEYSPEIVITNRIDWDYNPEAYNELADSTLDKLACKDDTVRALLEECIGYCFYRRNELGKAFILTGDKSNGKSTYLDIVKTILGDENISALDLKELGDRFSTSMMFGKLANIGDDIGDDFLQGNQVAVFKKIVTGNRIKAERKGQDPFEFNPYVKLLFSANDIPRMKDKTGAVLRRLVIIPFNARFSKDDPDYRPYIKYELTQREPIEYFIKLGIAGLHRVLTNNQFTDSKQVEEQLKDYEQENNPILGFLSEADIDVDIINEPTNEVYRRYTVFCAENNVQPMSNGVFSKQICKRLELLVADKKIGGKRRRVFMKEDAR